MSTFSPSRNVFLLYVYWNIIIQALWRWLLLHVYGNINILTLPERLFDLCILKYLHFHTPEVTFTIRIMNYRYCHPPRTSFCFTYTEILTFWPSRGDYGPPLGPPKSTPGAPEPPGAWVSDAQGGLSVVYRRVPGTAAFPEPAGTAKVIEMHGLVVERLLRCCCCAVVMLLGRWRYAVERSLRFCCGAVVIQLQCHAKHTCLDVRKEFRYVFIML